MNKYLIFCIDGKRFVTINADIDKGLYVSANILNRTRTGFEENESGLRLWRDKPRLENVDERLKFLNKITKSNTKLNNNEIELIKNIINYFKSHFVYDEVKDTELFSVNVYTKLANKHSYYQRKKYGNI